MFADKTLLLKGLAGVAAVGAAGGGTFIFRKELGLVDSSNNANEAGKDAPEEDETAIPSGTGSGAQTEEKQNDEQLAQQQAEETERKSKEAKKNKVNDQLTKLGLTDCLLSDGDLTSSTEFSKECELDQTKLQKINFSNKGSNNVTVTGLDGNIKLKIANKETDKVSYKFSGAASKITISGDSTKPDIVLKENVEREFEEKEDKLSKISQNTPEEEEKIKELNKKLSTLKIPDQCRFDVTEKEESLNCDLDQDKFKKIRFSNSQNNDDVTVTGWGQEQSNINLKIEKKDNNKLGYKFSGASSKLTIKGASTKPNITLKASEEREFEERESKLGKVAKDPSLVTKIKELNGKLEKINIPTWCRFEEEDSDTSLECDFSNKNDELKKIVFLNKDKSNDLTIVGSTENLKLTINRFEDDQEGTNKYQPEVDLEFLFSGYSQEIKIQAGTSFETNDISLKPNTNPLFTITNNSTNLDASNKLAKYFTSNTIDGKLNLSCTKDTSSSNYNCTPYPKDKKIKVLNSAGGNVEEITIQESETNTTILKTAENTENYELGIKFTVTEAYPTTNSKLMKNSTYEPKYIKGKGWGLSKKSQ